MEALLLLIYLVNCAVVVCLGSAAIFRMGPRTQHLRRLAFIALTFGGAVAFIEALRSIPIGLSASAMAIGAGMLLAAGVRGGKRASQ